MNTPLIRLTLILLLGICLGFYLEPSLEVAFLALLCACGLFLVALLRAKKLLFQDLFFGSTTFLLFFLLGIWTTALHLPQNQPGHYMNQLASEENSPLLRLHIRETLKPDLFNYKYIAEVQSVNHKNSHGKILLLVPKDSLKIPFLEGFKIKAAARPEAIRAPLNPHQFNYSRFMAIKGIHQQIDLRGGRFVVLPEESSGITAAATAFRTKIIRGLKENGFGKEELAIVQALLLGQKQDISAETYNNFAAAGAIHILAVSGLHVGIILLILNRLFAPLTRFKKGKILRTFLVVLGLWGFALLAGLSPSVVRAVTMFSFIAVGLEIKRRTGTLNSIFLSLMLLLLIKPLWVFDVGFQLSYSAVLAIVLFQPLFSGLFFPSTKIGKYFWDLLTVTMAAQLGVLPLSLYYFHQFPGLFFLSNLLILPFLGLILIFGVLVIVLALIGALPSLLLKAYEASIEWLNAIVEMVARQEQFVFKDISFSLSEVWAWYLLIFLSFLLWRNFSYGKLIGVLSAVVVLQFIYISQEVQEEDHLVVFHRSRSTLLGKEIGKTLKLYGNNPVPATSMIRNYAVGERIDRVVEYPLKNIYFQKGHFLILLDSTGILPKQRPKDFQLLLSNSPRVNLERIIQEEKPAFIIADGSNYRSMVTRWKATAEKHKIPFHYTAEKGAYLLE